MRLGLALVGVVMGGWLLVGCGDDGGGAGTSDATGDDTADIDFVGGETPQDTGSTGDDEPETGTLEDTEDPAPEDDASGGGGEDDAGPDPVEDAGGDPVEDVQDPPEDTGHGDPGHGDPPTAIGGGVLLNELDSASLNLASASARFTDPIDPTPEGDTFGECIVSWTDPDAPPPAAFGYDAGTITVSGTLEDITLTPVSEGSKGTGYSSSVGDDAEDLLPGGGALVTVAAAGGAHIGAYSMIVQMPEPVTMSAPPNGFGVTVDASSDLTVSWNAGTGDSVLITMTPLAGLVPAPVAGHMITCIYDGDSGSEIVPVAALQAASSLEMAAIGITRIRVATKDVEGLEVTATASRSTGGLITLE